MICTPILSLLIVNSLLSQYENNYVELDFRNCAAISKLDARLSFLFLIDNVRFQLDVGLEKIDDLDAFAKYIFEDDLGQITYKFKVTGKKLRIYGVTDRSGKYYPIQYCDFCPRKMTFDQIPLVKNPPPAPVEFDFSQFAPKLEKKSEIQFDLASIHGDFTHRQTIAVDKTITGSSMGKVPV